MVGVCQPAHHIDGIRDSHIRRIGHVYVLEHLLMLRLTCLAMHCGSRWDWKILHDVKWRVNVSRVLGVCTHGSEAPCDGECAITRVMRSSVRRLALVTARVSAAPSPRV